MWMLLWLWLGWTASAAEPVPAPAVQTRTLEDGSVEVRPDRQVPAEARDASALLLEFGDTSLYDLTLFFADLMRKNFMISDPEALQGKTVRLIGHEGMTVDEAWQAYRSALRAHGFTTTEVGEMVTVVPATDAARGSLPIGTGAPGRGQGFTTRMLPLDNARVTDLVTVVKPLLSESAEVIAYAPANTLIVTDVADNVRKIADLVGELDISAPTSQVRLHVLEHANATDVRSVLEALYPVEEPEAPQTSTKRPSRRGRKVPEPETTTTGVESRHISRILDDPRTNTLIVLANPEGHQAVADIVAKLDTDVQRSKLHVVRLKYALADEVAAVLQALQQGQAAAPPRRGGKGEAPQDTDLAAALDGDARFAADPASNSLAVVAAPGEFEAIAELIGQLDVARGQVFVDAVFVELTAGRGNELGVSAHLLPDEDGLPVLGSAQLDPDGDLNSFAVSPDLLAGLAAGVFGPAVELSTAEGSLQVPLFGIALRALTTSSDVQIMDNPGLLALDHEEATLAVGRRIPYAATGQLSAAGLPTTTFQREDVNMELIVTPHINDATLVTLDFKLTVDEVEGSATEAALQGGPVTSGRNVDSRVMVEHGQTIVIATLADSKVETTESRIPILGDIPLLGALFRGKKKETRRTELMVFLTPYVVERPSDLLEIRRIKEAQRAEFVRRFQGKVGPAFLEELDALLTPPAS